MDPISQVAVGLLVAVLAAAPVAVINRPFGPRPSDGQQNAIATDGSTVNQHIDNRSQTTTTTNFHTIENYIDRNAPTNSPDESDDLGGAVVAIGILIVLAGLLAVYSNVALLVSTFLMATLILFVLNLATTTKRRFGPLPKPAVYVLGQTAILAGLTAVVWFLVFTVERHGASLAAASEVARESGSRLPAAELLQAFGIPGTALLASFAAAVALTFLLALMVASNLLGWAAALWVAASLERGKTPSQGVLQRAHRFETLGFSAMSPTVVLGAIAIVLASGVIPALIDSVPAPTPVSVVTPPYQP
ncbi:MAG: hypothetical protein QM662_05245 [Gordonia sp. (in: high G+C Gram-positive bacteria)]